VLFGTGVISNDSNKVEASDALEPAHYSWDHLKPWQGFDHARYVSLHSSPIFEKWKRCCKIAFELSQWKWVVGREEAC
jgi:hypothetical protein